MLKIETREDGDVVVFPNKCCARHLIRHDGTREVLEYWHPIRTGQWGRDCQTGRDYAIHVVQYMRDESDPLLLTKIMQDMTLKAVFGGVETGFCTAISELVASG